METKIKIGDSVKIKKCDGYISYTTYKCQKIYKVPNDICNNCPLFNCHIYKVIDVDNFGNIKLSGQKILCCGNMDNITWHNKAFEKTDNWIMIKRSK